MKENRYLNLVKNSKFSTGFSKYTGFLLIIIGTALLIRFYYFPSEVPLNNDALYYFWYSSDIYQTGTLPKDWSPTNNGWSIFVSFFFTIFDSKDIYTLMWIQRLLSVLISVLVSIPVYFLCKKFVARKFAIIGTALIAFDPRLMINSFLAVTDALYLLLITTSLVLFLFSNKKLVYFSFVFVSLATIIRGEGIFFLISLSVLFCIKYRKEKYKLIFNYTIILTIILLIIIPITVYRIDVNGNDPLFTRSISSTNDVITEIITSENVSYRIFDGLKIFIYFLIWITIPNFIIFLPLGIFLIFQGRDFKKNTVIITILVTVIPAFYAYTFPAMPALDTRYLYVLLPMFSVLAVLAIEKIVGKLQKSNIIIIIIISAIIISSMLFYDYKKIDYEHEKEAFEIMKKISSKVNGINYLYQESEYLITSQTIEQWPNTYSKMKFSIITISTNNYNSIQDFIIESKDKGLTHIIIDDKNERQVFLKNIFFEEDNYPYLQKIYDSEIDGFTYHVKVFEIDYELFDSLKSSRDFK